MKTALPKTTKSIGMTEWTCWVFPLVVKTEQWEVRTVARDEEGENSIAVSKLGVCPFPLVLLCCYCYWYRFVDSFSIVQILCLQFQHSFHTQ